MTIIPEDIAVKMIKNGQSLNITCNVSPGYGIGYGVGYSVTLLEHGEVVCKSYGNTIENTLKYMINSEAFSEAVV